MMLIMLPVPRQMILLIKVHFTREREHIYSTLISFFAELFAQL